MLKNYFQKIRYIGMFSVIFGLIMANFFHAVLMDFDPALLVADTYGACHSHEVENGIKTQGSQNDLLPCCADKKNSEATTLLALFDFSKLTRPFSGYLIPISPASADILPTAPFLGPPNQVALDKIVLRI